MRVFAAIAIFVLVLSLGLGALSLAYTTPGAALRAHIACSGQDYNRSLPITQASPRDQRCLLARAEVISRRTNASAELHLRASLWNADEPPTRALLASARRTTRSAALSALATAGWDQGLAFNNGYSCFAPISAASPIIDQAAPDARSELCARLFEIGPPRLQVAAVAEVIPWDGDCPDPLEERQFDSSLISVGYAGLAGSEDAAACMLMWMEAGQWEEGVVFWGHLYARLERGADEHDRARQAPPEITALINRLLSGARLSEADGRIIEGYLL